MRNPLLNELARKGKTFTFSDAKRDSTLSSNSLRVLLHRLEKGGYIQRVEREKYIIIPLGAEKEEYTLHEFLLASMVIDDPCIAYWSALNYYGFTEQIPNTVFLQSLNRKKKTMGKVLGINYRVVRISSWKYFGTRNVWIEDERVRITDEEKTLVDCLDRPDLCGGVVEIMKGLRTDRIDHERLKDYSLNMRNTGIIRRLGYLLDILEIDGGIAPIETRNYLFLDPTMVKKGVKNSKWRLVINIDSNELRENL